MSYPEIYLQRAYWIDENNKGGADTTKQFIRGTKEWPKYSIYGLGIRSEIAAKEMASLEVGQSYKDYTRIR